MPDAICARSARVFLGLLLAVCAYEPARDGGGAVLRGTMAASNYSNTPFSSLLASVGCEAASASHRSNRSWCSRRTSAAAMVCEGRCLWSAWCTELLKVQVPLEARARYSVLLAPLEKALRRLLAALHTGQGALRMGQRAYAARSACFRRTLLTTRGFLLYAALLCMPANDRARSRRPRPLSQAFASYPSLDRARSAICPVLA